jgi:hypothetical protein
MLKFLGVSRSGYRSFLNRKLSPIIQRKETIKKKIRLIYDASKQNYGAPKITKELQKSGETIAERTVGKYMREMGIKAQWIKPFTTTTGNSDFSTELTNILDEHLTRNAPMPYGAQILLIYGLKMALSTLIVSWTCLPEKS